MDWFRQIQVHFFKGYNRAAILVVITSIITRQINALDSYEFRLGTNAIIPFSYTLDQHSQHSWEIFRVGVSDPFNINGTINQDALNPSQRDRFYISTNWRGDVLQVDLHIRDISKIDRGVYIWAVSQHAIRAKRLVMTFDVFVDVILPPGRAKCNIFPSPYSSGLREVHCQAAVGSDGGGQLICYQNDVKTPFQSSPDISATKVSAVFWMDAQYDIKCCSYEANYEKVPGHCNDFTKAVLIKSDIQPPKTTRKLDSTTLKKIEQTVSPSSPIEREHFTDSASSTEVTTYFSNEYKHHHPGYVATICILSIALVLLVCMNITNKAYDCIRHKFVENGITESEQTNITNKANNCTKDKSVEKEITESKETKGEKDSPPPKSRENQVKNCKV